MADQSIMDLDEVKCRLSIISAYKTNGQVYCVSPETYYRLARSIEYYLKTEELIQDENGEIYYV